MQDLLILSHTSNFIDDEEFLVLSDLFEWKNPCFPYEDYSPFNLDEMTESECLSEFRFRKRDIPILADVLGIPETIRCEQGSTCDGLEGLCMVLRRLSFPCRYADMIPRFAKPVPVISMVTNAVLDMIYATHSPRITRWNHDILDPDQMEMYAAAITARGAPPAKLLWIYRRHRKTNRSPWGQPTYLIQRPQAGACFEVPVGRFAKWLNC